MRFVVKLLVPITCTSVCVCACYLFTSPLCSVAVEMSALPMFLVTCIALLVSMLYILNTLAYISSVAHGHGLV